MHLVKEITTTNMLIKIYSVNPDLIVDGDPAAFEGRDDAEIREIVFNRMGAEQIEIYDNLGDGLSDPRSYSLV